jgi:hypothetical protein
LNEDRRYRLISRGIDGFVTLTRAAFLAVAVVLVARYGRDVLVAFAGQQTSANLAFELLVNLQADRWLAYLVGVAGVSYGASERHLRRRNIKRLTERTEELEKRLHPGRTSSGLTPEGKTRREDR